jgi:hypothetical protein
MRRKRRDADVERERLEAERARLVEQASLIHHDMAAYEADPRVGATFHDPVSGVRVTRTPAPSRSLWAAEISVWLDGRR